MDLGDTEKKAEQLELDLWSSGRKPRWRRESVSRATAVRKEWKVAGHVTIEAIVERDNLNRAYKKVKANGGAAGVDRMKTDDLREHLLKEWPEIEKKLKEGIYQPKAVRRVDIPKATGGTRMLGIPTVVDRFIQQAIYQVMSPVWEEEFSENSYGFRPGRSTQQAVKAAREYVKEGYRWVVDIDLEKFFDRVNHDILMSRIARRIIDKRLLGLIRRYMKSGIMEGGVTQIRQEGTPQGGPLSPLLSNILLDDLDKELENRGHKFCRYADDCNIYVKSKRAGERVMESVREFLSKKLRLKVNLEKSHVIRPWSSQFLSYSMTSETKTRLKASKQAIKRFKDKVREKFRTGRGRKLEQFIKEELNPLLRGWANYFREAEIVKAFKELDGWIRRKLRGLIWRRWKRAYTRARNLIRLGIHKGAAWDLVKKRRGPWWSAGTSDMNKALTNAYFKDKGLVSLLEIIDT